MKVKALVTAAIGAALVQFSRRARQSYVSPINGQPKMFVTKWLRSLRTMSKMPTLIWKLRSSHQNHCLSLESNTSHYLADSSI
jgi:hypothetical protein